jgi:hypothetical protein
LTAAISIGKIAEQGAQLQPQSLVDHRFYRSSSVLSGLAAKLALTFGSLATDGLLLFEETNPTP